MKNSSVDSLEIAHFSELFQVMKTAAEDFTKDFVKLIQYTQFPIETEEQVLEMATIMDELMDISSSETDLSMVFATAISDRIEDFENQQLVMPKMAPGDVLVNLMKLNEVKQEDFTPIIPQELVPELINGNRDITIDNAKFFSGFFKVPVSIFLINCPFN